MTITQNRNGASLTIAVSGRLDTMTSPELEAVIDAETENAAEVVLDFSELEYISSAGLRVLLSTQKKMTKQGGSIKVTNINETVSEIFEVTGFADILNIE